MPAPQAAVLNAAAIAKFQSFQIQLPAVQSTQPMLASAGKSVLQPMKAVPGGPELFKAASKNFQDISRQMQMNDRYAKLFLGVTSGIAAAWRMFHTSATLQRVVINGPNASAGQIVCPNLDSIVLSQSSAAGTGQSEMIIRGAVANAFWNSWRQVMDFARVPGLPWYPSFAIVPMPLAPPTPNVPTPFGALIQMDVPMTAFSLKNAFISSLMGKMEYPAQFSEALAASIDASFRLWKVQTQVTNVLGTGPVPTFAPPYVPAGPVVGGTGTMLPGGFL